MTYSIVARDPRTGELGGAVQSHYFAAGTVVLWAEAGVGVVATQAIPDKGYGPLGLQLLQNDVPPPEALEQLLAADPGAPVRQVAIVDGTGVVAVHTGAGCVAHAGHHSGEGFCAQGNMLTNPDTWQAMADAYVGGRGSLAERLLAALRAGEQAGGDIRGRQSAAILIVGPNRSPRSWDEVRVDLRVDDHPDPLDELGRLVGLSHAFGLMTDSMLGKGLLTTPPEELPAGAVADGLAALEEAQTIVGDGNLEPTFWRGIALARLGRVDEARQAVATAAARHPGWAHFVSRLPAAGLLPDDAQLIARLSSPRP